MDRIKEAMQNGLLVFGSLLIFYVVGEILFFRLALPQVSLNLAPHLPARATIFMQGSTNERVPRDYLGLLGDSYAEGVGDWLLSIGGQAGLPHHSASAIHEILHRDVASFGHAADGSMEGMVLRTTQVLRDELCFLFPKIENPKEFILYFYEGNDINDNVDHLTHRVRPIGDELVSQVDKFLNEEYGSVPWWRCHVHFGNFIYSMARYAVQEMRAQPQVIDLPAGVNQVIIDGKSVGVPELQVPSVALDDSLIEKGIVVYERSLFWLRQHYPAIPVTIVYLPSPSAVYRYGEPEVVSYNVYLGTDPNKPGKPLYVDGRKFAPEAVYRNSQFICERIRAASLRQGAAFIDTRPALRSAGSKRALHGPRDWSHFNEAGYRLLGSLVAARLAGRPADNCNDSWESEVSNTR